MSEDEQDNGSSGREMHYLTIEVADELVWRLTGPKRVDQGRVQHRIEPARKESIDVLVRVLRHAMDAAEEDRIHEEIYRDLLKLLGRELFELLFTPDIQRIRRVVLNELQEVRQGDVTLRMVLTFAGRAEWLSMLPWEYLHTPIEDDSLGEGGGFLSQHAELLLSRRLEVPSRRLLGASPPLRLLLISSSPRDDGDDLGRVSAEIVRTALADLATFDVLDSLVEDPPDEEVAEYAWRVTYPELEAVVRDEKPDIVHFIGHGRMAAKHGELALARSDGKPHWVTDEAFAQAICQHQNLKLVFLQACESASLPPPYVGLSGVAQVVAKEGTPAVLAMQYPIKVPTANQFAVAFYQALDQELDIDVAVERGRAAIRKGKDAEDRERLAFGLPVVYLAEYGGLSALKRTGRGGSTLGPASETDAGGSLEIRPLCPNPECGQEFEPDDTYCTECSRRLPVHCRKCGRIFRLPPPRYCGNCREPVIQEAEVHDEAKLAEGVQVDRAANVRAAMSGPAD